MNRRTLLASALGTAPFSAGCLSTLPRDVGVGSEGTPPLSADDETYAGGFEPGSRWPNRGFDAARRGVNPDTRPPDGDVGAAWLRTPTEGARSFRTTSPVTDHTRVFVGSGAGTDEDGHDGFVAAFDGRTGERRWRTTVTDGAVDGLALGRDLVLAVTAPYEPSAAASLVALGAADGERRWRVELSGTQRGTPAVVGGRAYLASGDTGVTAVSLDGTRRWQQPVAAGEEHAATVPAATGSGVYVGTDQGRLVALDPDDGGVVWRVNVTDGGHRPRIQSTPTVADGTVYVPGTDYHLHAVDAGDGTIAWRHELLEERYGNGIPSVVTLDETVYVNTVHGGLIALRRADGSERWRTGAHGDTLPPAAAGDLVLAPTGSSVTAYTNEGDTAWTFTMPEFDAGMAAYIMSPRLALAHDRAYVALYDGRLFALASS